MPITTRLDRHVAYCEAGGPIVLYTVPDEFIGQEAYVRCTGFPRRSSRSSHLHFTIFLFQCSRCGALLLQDDDAPCVCGSQDGMVIGLDPAE